MQPASRAEDMKPCVRCATPHADAAAYCTACKPIHAANCKKYRDNRRLANSCLDCAAPPLPGKTRCEAHLEMQRVAQRAWKARAKERAKGREG